MKLGLALAECEGPPPQLAHIHRGPVVGEGGGKKRCPIVAVQCGGVAGLLDVETPPPGIHRLSMPGPAGVTGRRDRQCGLSGRRAGAAAAFG